MSKILVSGGLVPTTKDTLLDARTRVATFSDIANIENPARFMVITVEDTGKKYEVKKLTSKIIGGIVVEKSTIDINDPEALVDLGLAEELRSEDEKVRQSNEKKRIEAENLRKTAEDSRKVNETNRVSAEGAREASERTRVSSEETRNANEQTRNSNETKRQSQESTRQSQESARQTNESARKTNESVRKEAESERKTEETSRRTAELSRSSAENTRAKNEQNRTTAENTRSSAEDRRVANETQRTANETARSNAELSREKAEGNRASTFETLKGRMQTTIQEGQTAVAATEKATSDAQKVVDNYDTKVAEQDGKLSELGSEVGKLQDVDETTNIPVVEGNSISTTVIGYNDQYSIRRKLYVGDTATILLSTTDLLTGNALSVFFKYADETKYIGANLYLIPGIESTVTIEKEVDAIGFYNASALGSGEVTVRVLAKRQTTKNKENIERIEDDVVKTFSVAETSYEKVPIEDVMGVHENNTLECISNVNTLNLTNPLKAGTNYYLNIQSDGFSENDANKFYRIDLFNDGEKGVSLTPDMYNPFNKSLFYKFSHPSDLTKIIVRFKSTYIGDSSKKCHIALYEIDTFSKVKTSIVNNTQKIEKVDKKIDETVVKYIDGTLYAEKFQTEENGVSFSKYIDTPANSFTLRINQIVGSTEKYLVQKFDIDGNQSNLLAGCLFDKDYDVVIDKDVYPRIRIYAAPTYGTPMYEASETDFEVILYNQSIFEKKIENIENSSMPLKGKTVVMFGDSITQLPNTGTYRGDGIVEYFSEITGSNVFRAAVGGSRLTRTQAVTSVVDYVDASNAVQISTIVESFCKGDMSIPIAGMQYKIDNGGGDNYVIEMLSTLQTIDISDVDIVTIFGGTNDCSSGITLNDGDDDSLDTSNIRGALNYIIKTILEANPRIKIYIFTPIIRKYDPNDDTTWSDIYTNNSVGLLLPAYVDEIKKVGLYNHIPTCDLYNNMGWNKYNFGDFCLPTDYTHPRKGFDRLAEKMASFIKSSQ